MSIVLKVQEAVYTLLVADEDLANKITGVFDFVPEGQDLPYVTIGEIKSRKYSGANIIAEEVNLLVNVFSQNLGRKETLEIIENIRVVLDNAELVIGGCKNINTKFIRQEVLQNTDGISFAGRAEFRLLVQEI